MELGLAESLSLDDYGMRLLDFLRLIHTTPHTFPYTSWQLRRMMDPGLVPVEPETSWAFVFSDFTTLIHLVTKLYSPYKLLAF
jgi:hypothetical protein